MNKPKAFLFDYGGVMSDGGGSGYWQQLAKRLSISPEQVRRFIEPVWGDYIRGAISEDTAHARLKKSLGLIIDAGLRVSWNNGGNHMRPRSKMVELVQQLQQNGYPVGLVSNVIPPTANALRKKGDYEVYDFCILSCEVGYAKPEPEIYELALQHLPGIAPQEVIFVDDQERCLLGAQNFGMRTILARSTAQIIRDVQARIN